MSSVVSPPFDNARDPNLDDEFSRVISSTWHVLEQIPPPSLREVLGAYNSKGDGDRDMLIAMLNAKSAEDQRMASVAALHQTLLETLHHTPRSHLPLPHFHVQHSTRSYPAPHSISCSPPIHEMKPASNVNSLKRSPPRKEAPSQSPKRQRTSPSPHRSSSSQSYSFVRHEHPSSPHSSSRSDSAEYSPRSRASMAIGSLLSSGPHSGRGIHISEGRGNDYMSPSTSVGPISV